MRRLGGAALPVLLLVAVLSGCGNSVSAEVVGATAVGVTRDGDLVGLVALCGGTFDEFTVSADRTGLKEDEPNPVLTTEDVPSAQDGIATVPLAMSGVAPGWSFGNGAVLERGRTYIALAAQADADVEAVPANFSVDQLDGLEPDQVVAGEGTVQTRAAFAKSCD